MTDEQFRNLKVGDKIFRSGRLYSFTVLEVESGKVSVAQVKSLTLSDVSEGEVGPEGLLGPQGAKATRQD